MSGPKLKNSLLNTTWLLVACGSAIILWVEVAHTPGSAYYPRYPLYRPGDLFVGVVLPAGLVCLSLYGLFARGAGKSNALLVMISTLLSLYACEFALLALRIPEEYAVARGYTSRTYRNRQEALRLGLPFEYKTIGELIRERRAAGQDCVPILSDLRVPTTDGRLANQGGASNKCTLFASNESGAYASYTSDAFGFNNAEHDPNTEYDLVFIGDSFAHGAAVRQEYSIAAVARGHGYRVLNLAMGGTGPIRQMAIYREYGSDVSHDVVVWFFFEGNDIHDLRNEKKRKLYRRYLSPEFSQGLRAKQAEIDTFLVNYIGNRLRVKEGSTTSYRRATMRLLNDAARLGNIRSRVNLLGDCGYRRTVLKGSDIKLFREILSLVKGQAVGDGARLVFVYLPSWERFSECGVDDALREKIKLILEEHDVQMLDITESFTRHPDPLELFPYRLSNHYNEKGYGLVASELIRVLSMGAGE